jgi:hypothetical protein
MSDSLVDAVGFLEQIQKEYFKNRDAGGLIAGEITKDIAAKFNLSPDFLQKIEKAKSEARSKMFSKFEPLDSFMILLRLTEEIEETLHSLTLEKQTKKVLFGSLGTGDINGVAIEFENPDYFIVLIDDGVFGFANLLAKALAQCFPLVGSEGDYLQISVELDLVKSRLEEKPDIADRFTQLVLGYVIGGNPHAAPPYLPEKEYVGLLSIWRDAMEMFILAHEFGHASLGHLEGNTRAAIVHDGFNELPMSWQQEYEADQFGLFLTLATLNRRGLEPSLTYAGIEAFFLGLELIEKTLCQLNGVVYDDQGSESHPPAAQRRKSMRDALKHFLEEDQQIAAVRLASILDEVLRFVEPPLRRAVERGRSNGVSPHAKWC